MARVTTKADLITFGNEKFEKLWKLFNTLSQEEQIATFELDGKEAHWKRDKNIRDILIHLYEWHQLLINWIESNKKGTEKQFLPEPYNWKTYGDMNIEFWKKHQNTSLNESIKIVKTSHEKIMDLIEKFTNEELFSKGVFTWTGGSTLGQYCSSTTASHYDWAMTKIKKYKKQLNDQ